MLANHKYLLLWGPRVGNPSCSWVHTKALDNLARTAYLVVAHWNSFCFDDNTKGLPETVGDVSSAGVARQGPPFTRQDHDQVSLVEVKSRKSRVTDTAIAPPLALAKSSVVIPKKPTDGDQSCQDLFQPKTDLFPTRALI